jgi:acyl-CoA synthetase (AMP-forming)/AMP-acid ligase II
LPKAALVKHHRFHRAGAVWSSLALDLRHRDVMYCCLPLYHSNAVLLAASSTIMAGATLALARKFSRTNFWEDVRRHGATAFIYIGELCRYLLSAEPNARDREHRVRVVTGNGLRPDIWQAFQERFGLERIVEFYASTEGNCITFNLFNVRGSVGPLVPGMALARWDEAAQDFVRDSHGRLQRAKHGEPGILLGKIRPGFEFDGYRDSDATSKKVLRDVFRDGDAYLNPGDLLRSDRFRHLYFTDRVGDTFRWKGENVSTTEVQEALSKWAGLAEINVYGVQVPGTEGRAGMAAIALHPGASFDAVGFAAHVRKALPAYSRPAFLRVAQQLEVTSTFKLKKQELQREGFDPAQVSDPLYFLDDARGQYVRLDATLYAAIASGAVRL